VISAVLYDSPVGRLRLVGDEHALDRLDWAGSDRSVGTVGPVLRAALDQLDAYFAGRLLRFDLPLAPAPTPFAGRVREAMRAIPYGETASYGELARRLDSNPRAVGAACGANPIAIVVPCHRVVAAGGGLGGYSGGRGADTKRALLAHECTIFSPAR
jgi:methylated-DNA-[protein]-cysteine S-methyltransferase